MPTKTPILNALAYMALVVLFFVACHVLCGCSAVVTEPTPSTWNECVQAEGAAVVDGECTAETSGALVHATEPTEPSKCSIDGKADAVTVCGSASRYVLACDTAIKAPAVECAGPVSYRSQAYGTVWCCQ